MAKKKAKSKVTKNKYADQMFLLLDDSFDVVSMHPDMDGATAESEDHFDYGNPNDGYCGEEMYVYRLVHVIRQPVVTPCEHITVK